MMFEPIPLNFVTFVTSTLGLPGLLAVFWYFDHKKIDAVLAAYKEDVNAVSQMYRDNVELVKGYERLSGDLAGIITLNTQTITSLVEQIRLTNDMLRRER